MLSAVLAICWVLVGTAHAAAKNGDRGNPNRPIPLVEQSDCRDPRPPAHLDSNIAPQAVGVQQRISVTAPATALLRVDHGGHVVAAATNTGCAPRPGDDLFYVRPDGTVEPTPTSELAHRRWFGDFTEPGVFVPQRG
jgi:hypothetical protein